MAAIFDLRDTQTTDSIPASLSVLPNPKKHGNGRWHFVVVMLRYAMYECGYIYFRFDRRHFEFLSNIGVCYHWQRPPWVHPTKNLAYNVILFSHITYSIGLFTTCYHMVYFTWISLIKVANMTSCLLRSRNAKVMKSMLSCEEFICAQSHKNFYHICLDKIVTQQKVFWGYFPSICNTRVGVCISL